MLHTSTTILPKAEPSAETSKKTRGKAMVLYYWVSDKLTLIHHNDDASPVDAGRKQNEA